jgi:hypothetical protein
MDAFIRKFPIGGLKLSSELIQVRLAVNDGFPMTAMFQRLADQQINLTHLLLDGLEGNLAGVFCISAEARKQAELALKPFEGLYEMRLNVGTMTVFPIQSRLDLIRDLMSAIGRAGLPVYGLASSLSSLTIFTDYLCLDEAVQAACQVVELPDNHAPFRPEFRVKQL